MAAHGPADRQDPVSGHADHLAVIHGLAALLLDEWDQDHRRVHRDEAIAAHLEDLRPPSVDREQLLAGLERLAGGPGPREGDEDGEAVSEPDGPPLSEREGEVLTLLAQGLTNRQIAERLFLSPETIKTYVSRVYAKIGVGNRTGAAVWVLHHCDSHRAGARSGRPPRSVAEPSAGTTSR